MNYKEIREEYISLLEQLNSNLMQQNGHLSKVTQGDKPQKTGVVYVLNRVGTDEYKIGVSTNYASRLKVFEVKLPFPVKEVAVYRTQNFFSKEKELHQRFAEKRLNGSEFFKLTAEELTEIPKIIYEHEAVDETGETLIDSDAEILEEARELCIEEGKASTSFLQRRLRIGYARAARLMDALEDEGFVSPPDGGRPRDVIGVIPEIENITKID